MWADGSISPNGVMIAYCLDQLVRARIWLDKDERFSQLPTSSDKDYWIQSPSEQEFREVCNEFWWVCPYVAKGLARNQITYAKGMMDGPLRNAFDRMIEIYAGTLTGFTVTIGKNGKYLPQYLSASDYKALLNTYPDHKAENLTHALDRMMDMFSRFATAVSNRLHYVYNKDEEMYSRKYLKAMLHEGFGNR